MILPLGHELTVPHLHIHSCTTATGVAATQGWPAECFRQGKCGSGRFPNGTIMHDPVRYPSGIKALADYVHSLGLRFGEITS